MKPGEVVADRFEVAELAGQGGMGAVYRARDRQSGRVVALKALTDPGGNHVERFLREAQVLQDLRHPGIVGYIAHGRAASGQLYMAMEWVDGESISQRVARQPFTVPQAVYVTLQIAQGLAEAHRHGVVHRDIKPSNVFVHRTSLEVKVLDFGIARLSEAARLTGVGMMLGTPGYMAPEQARGVSTIDARADVFSLGCVFFKCLTGRPPFMSEDVRTVLAQVLFDAAPSVSSLRKEVPPSIDAVVARMLAKKPPERQADGSVVAAELEVIYGQLVTGTSRRPVIVAPKLVVAPIPLTAKPIPLTAAPIPLSVASTQPPARPIPLTAAPIPLSPAPIPLTAAPPKPTAPSAAPKAMEMRIVVPDPVATKPHLGSIRVAASGTEVDMPVAGDGPAATEMEVPAIRIGTAATERQVPAVRLGGAATEVELPASATPTLPAPATAWVRANAAEGDLPTSIGVSPFAASPFGAPEGPAGPSASEPPPPAAVDWEPPTFVRAAEELPEPPQVVRAFADAQQAHAIDDLDAVLEATTRGLASVSGPSARGRLLALQAEARLWRGQHDLALAASTAALAALALDRTEWGIAAMVQAKASAARGDLALLASLAQVVLELDKVELPSAAYAGATVAVQLWKAGRADLAQQIEGRLHASPMDQRAHPVVHATLLQMQAAGAAWRGDLAEAAQLGDSAANLLRASGRTLPSIEAGVEAARWRARLGELEPADTSLGELHRQASQSGARWLEVEASSSAAQVAARRGRGDGAVQLARAGVSRMFPGMGNVQRGHAQLILAEVLERSGHTAEAAVELKASREHLLPGTWAASALTLQSRIALTSGKKAESIEHGKAAVAYFEAAPAVLDGELAARLALTKGLFAVGLNDAGRAELTKACDRLKVHASAIRAVTARTGFLTQVSEHHQLLELAAWWLGQAVR